MELETQRSPTESSLLDIHVHASITNMETSSKTLLERDIPLKSWIAGELHM